MPQADNRCLATPHSFLRIDRQAVRQQQQHVATLTVWMMDVERYLAAFFLALLQHILS